MIYDEDYFIETRFLDLGDVYKDVFHISDLESYFEELTGMGNCILFGSLYEALSSILNNYKTFYEYQYSFHDIASIAYLFGLNIVSIRTEIFFEGVWGHEYVNSMSLNKENSLLYLSVPSITGAMPVNIWRLINCDIDVLLDYQLAQKTIITNYVDYVLVRLRTLIPVSKVKSVILCSDQKLSRTNYYDHIKKELFVLTNLLVHENEICMRREQKFRRYLDSISYTNARFITRYYCSPRISFQVMRREWEEPSLNYHRLLYISYPTIITLHISGFENMEFINNAVKEHIKITKRLGGGSDTPGGYIINL